MRKHLRWVTIGKPKRASSMEPRKSELLRGMTFPMVREAQSIKRPTLISKSMMTVLARR